MHNILESGAFELAEQIKSGELKSLDVVQAHIDEILKWNPELNALVEDRFTDAISEARACDRKISELNNTDPAAITKLPPLFGVPFTIKEMISVEGFRHTLGSVHRKENIAKQDATVVERLKKAGAILMGTTNVPELGFWFECENPVYGRTNNPYDLKRTAGGSTGGEAALIGAGASPFGLGSDVGGSIRMPAGFCGIFGHKPSAKIIPMTGHFPIYQDNAAFWKGSAYPLTVIGPLARRAKDLYPLMQLLIGIDNRDPETRGDFKLKPRVKSWVGKTVWMLPSPRMAGAALTDGEISDSVRIAARYFEAMGADLKEMRSDIFKDALGMWFAAMTRSKVRSFTDTMTSGQDLSYARELLKSVMGRGQYTLPALAASALEVFGRKNETKVDGKRRSTLAALEDLQKELTGLLGEDAILILPNHPRVAPRHSTTLLRPFDYIYTGIFNALEFPSTACTMGLDEGIPVAIQIVSGPDQDHFSLSAAEVLEDSFGGWKRPEFPSN